VKPFHNEGRTAVKKIRYGVIGIKGVGRLHIASAQASRNAALTALVDVNEAFLKHRSDELTVRLFTDHRDMLAAGVVDAVSIATPHHLLAPITLDCLNAGVHVFVEKPFAIRLSEADAMIQTAKAKGLKLCVGYIQRTYRLSLAMRQLLESDAIGNLMRLLWTWQEFRPESYYTPDLWRGTFREAGGGVLMSQASHQLDLICSLVGRPTQVSAFMSNQLHKNEVEDLVGANVCFANGALGTLQFSLNQSRAHSIRELAGDRGLLVIQDVKSLVDDEDDTILLGKYEDTLSAIVTQLPGGGDQPDVVWQSINLSKPQALIQHSQAKESAYRFELGQKMEHPMAHAALMNSFIDAIVNGGEPIVSGESARSSVEVINALILSAIRKKVVELPIDPEEYDRLADELSEGSAQVPRQW
jgi:predicted dehydrogenase